MANSIETLKRCYFVTDRLFFNSYNIFFSLFCCAQLTVFLVNEWYHGHKVKPIFYHQNYTSFGFFWFLLCVQEDKEGTYSYIFLHMYRNVERRKLPVYHRRLQSVYTGVFLDFCALMNWSSQSTNLQRTIQTCHLYNRSVLLVHMGCCNRHNKCSCTDAH